MRWSKRDMPILNTPIKTALFSIVFTSSVSAGMITDEGLAPYEICGLCHSLDGVSRMAKFPKLAGQPPLYIKKQIKDFMTEKRTNDGGQMVAIMTEVDPTTIDEIADWFAAQSVPSPELETDLDLSIGKALFEKQKCATCHRGVGQQAPHIPYLFAQHQSYLAKQMRDFRDGNRDNDAGQLMQNAMGPLSDDEIELISTYLASKERN